MPPHPSKPIDRPWYRQFWPWLLLTPPAIAVIAGLYTLYLSVQNSPALVVDDYRKIGLVNHQKMERDALASQLGLAGILRTSGTELEFAFVPRDLESQAPLAPDPLLLQFFHPTLEERDFQLTLLADDAGRYHATLPALSDGRFYLQLLPADRGVAGQWRLVGEWRSADELSPLAPNRVQD